MKCTCNANDSTYITLSFFSKSNTSWVILKYHVFHYSNTYWLVDHKSVSSVPNANSFAFYGSTPPTKTHSVIRA